MDDTITTRRAALATCIAQERAAQIGSQREAADAANVNRNTWNRLESGAGVSDVTYAAVERILRWPRGSILRYLRGQADLPARQVAQPGSVPTGAQVGTLRAENVAGLPADAEALLVTHHAQTPLDQLALLQEWSHRIIEAERQREQ